jgi:hypothetical protein
MVGGAAPASAAPHSPVPLKSVEQLVSPLTHRAEELRAILAEGGVLSAVRAAAAAAGHPEAASLPRLDPATGFRASVRALLQAILEADAIIAAAPAPPALPRARTSFAPAIGERTERLRKLSEGIDPAPALRAAARIASAVDAVLPALRASALRMAPAPRAAACDVLAQEGICVSGTGSNEYTDDVALIVDLGGNDLYRNAAGFGSAGAGVVLDLDGNDRYEAPDGLISAQGAGNVGGVGMLLDLDGNDAYRAADTSLQFGVAAQGSGETGAVGILLDAAGNDLYEVRSDKAAGSGTAFAGGQGMGLTGGVGALVDGGGDDTYLAAPTMFPGTPSPQRTPHGAAVALAQGLGNLGGAGLLADAAGTDRLTVSASAEPVAADAPPVQPEDDSQIPIASANGQASASTGAASFLLAGPGDTRYELLATVGPLPGGSDLSRAQANGQATAFAGATAVLSDAGGGDEYVASAIGLSGTHRTIASCPCPSTLATVGSALSHVQGYGALGHALLHDAAGDDRYTSEARVTVALELTDARPSAGGPPLAGSLWAGLSQAIGQGAGLGAGHGGVLVDVDGDDRYETNAWATVSADGTSEEPAPAPVFSYETSAFGVGAQGWVTGRMIFPDQPNPSVAVGALMDTGGLDGYFASSSGVATIDGVSSSVPPPIINVQGSADSYDSAGLAILFDADGSGGDTFSQTPAVPACFGVRGQSVWRDCGTVGIGINA